MGLGLGGREEKQSLAEADFYFHRMVVAEDGAPGEGPRLFRHGQEVRSQLFKRQAAGAVQDQLSPLSGTPMTSA